jgi:hypothetical protein
MKKMWLATVMMTALFIVITGCGANSENSQLDSSMEKNKQNNTDVTTEEQNDQKDNDQSSEASAVQNADTKEEDPSIVYMTKDISPEGLMRIYKALGREASGKVAVKVHMGEPGGNNYLKPDLVKDLVLSVNGTFVDSNTAYGGLRANTAAHMQAAEDHGFTAYTSVDILDAEGEITLPIENGKHLKEDVVGSHYENYDFIIVLSHFKGHAMGGFGGAIKNMSIGFASARGKNLIHTAGKYETNRWLSGSYDQLEFLESMAEAAKAIVDDAGENILYINVMNNLSIDCDCDSSPAAPRLADIGILASLDPVALDKACVDLIFSADETESATLRTRINSRQGTHTLDYAEELGIGSQKYELVMIDD